ncbi:MAG: hypothetical protein K2J90_13975 [Lachnospiraceae bacterium]|nr:hypothetical protein [Lachnospiraceae bacterium]
MKKVTIILFRIAYIFILIVVIFIVIFTNINRMRGKLSVTINEKEYLPDSLECQYVDKGTEEKIIYKNKSSRLCFKNSGSAYGIYEYSFDVNNEEINIRPKVSVFKTDWWKIQNINLDVNVYKDDTIWDAAISAEVNGRTYNKTFNDIENNAIEFRIE